MSTPRALIRDVSVEAAQDGLVIGMPLDHARRLCTALHVLSPNPQLGHYDDEALLFAIARYAPV